MKALLAGVLLVLVLPGDVAGQFPETAAWENASTPADTVRLADLVAEARSNNPSLRAAGSRAAAARERGSRVGTLPNPEIFLGLRNRPLDGFGTDQPMTMNVVGARQKFPWPGVQGYARDEADLLAAADSLDAVDLEHQLVAGLTAAYYRAAALDRLVLIMRRTRELLRGFHQVALANYEVGRGLQQDVLQAQVSVARMTEDITLVQQQRLGLTARINAIVGRPWQSPLEALELPAELGPIPTADSLVRQAAASRPSLAAAAERVAAADAAYRSSRRKLYPDFTVAVEYGQRPQFVDFLSVMVGIEIPLWAGKRELPQRREAEQLRSSSEFEARDLYHQTIARVLELVAEADRARNLTMLYRGSVLPQAAAAVESAMAAYRVGDIDFNTLVESELTRSRYQMQLITHRADYHRALAELEAITGSPVRGTGADR